jgi:threonine dehydratase
MRSRRTLSEMISLDDVLRAREAIGDRLHRTPVFDSRTLSAVAGARVLLKAELFQRTGSFKPRGMLAKFASLAPEEKRKGVVSISAGNAAQAVAYAAALEEVDALVVMWQGASAQKVEATRAYGGAVDLSPSGPVEAFDRLREVIDETGRTLVHPFDDPVLIAGHGSLGLELVEDVPDVDVVVVPVGGGGLVSGVVSAVKRVRPRARVYGIEPEGSTALHDALAAGEVVRVDPHSRADALNAPYAGDHCLAVCRELLDGVLLVSEAELEAGFRFLYARAKLACEVGGAAATAALLAGKVPLEQGETVVAVVSGGNTAAETASAILAGR